MRFSLLRVACLLAFACFVSVTWIKPPPSDDTSMAPGLQIFFKRLLVAEELGGRVSKDLSSILEQLVNMSKVANSTHLSRNSTANGNNTISTEAVSQSEVMSGQQPLLQPNIYLYMPHLKQHPGSLMPNVVLGQGRRGVSMVLGIPTVKREKESYLSSTLGSLLSSLTSSQCQDLLIIVFVAETDSDYVNSVAQTIKTNFPKEVKSGLLEVVSPSQYYYPDFKNLEETLGDSMDRVRWRSKQNLDFSFLMLYAQDKGTFYVQLEDDIVAKEDYYSKMKSFAIQEASKKWLYLEFSQLGFIGKMFQTRDLPMIAEFFLMFHRDKPIDWLLDHILWVKVCNPEKSPKDCDEQKALLKQQYKPSLFQHMGLHSSLPGKLQPLKDKKFGKQTYSNPPAELSSSLKYYKQHNLDRVYNGEDFLWALTPVQGDYILFSFPQPIHISGYLFCSGNAENTGDKFYNTTVEVLPSNMSAKDKRVIGSSSKYKESDKGFFIIGAFQNGVAEGKIEEVLQPVSALRLVVHSESDVWAVLSKVHIKV